jgi:hypothetical protein
VLSRFALPQHGLEVVHRLDVSGLPEVYQRYGARP